MRLYFINISRPSCASSAPAPSPLKSRGCLATAQISRCFRVKLRRDSRGILRCKNKPQHEDKADDDKQDGKERSRKGNRFHPYKDKQDRKAGQRNRVFISNIPYDMKWQAIKDLMREKVGEVTYVELFKDAEGKSRVSDVAQFKDHEFVKKALDVMNKYVLSGRPLNISSDPDGEIAQRVLQRFARGPLGGRPDMAPGVVNIPPSIANNPNIPPEVIHALRAGRLGTTIFVANLDYKVGWKKLKEVFSMAGVVKRADVKEDKDGRSRGMGMVIFEQPLEAVQAISMFNGQILFDRQMLVKMDDKSIVLDDGGSVDKGPHLPRGLSGVGMGLGPGGQPINANRLSGGGDICPMRPGGGLDFAPVFCSSSDLCNSCADMYRSGMGGMDRDFGRSDMAMNRGFGDSFGGMGQVMYAEIKMENGRSKGSGTVRFDCPESAEKAIRLMNGTKINGREVDVRLDRTT
uniref:RRM domain-containing protein n=1 Tax=Periophthalmus magnuspinnatus TaxID=409849 RepID=A0A3B3ZBA7_9GOBI